MKLAAAITLISLVSSSGAFSVRSVGRLDKRMVTSIRAEKPFFADESTTTTVDEKKDSGNDFGSKIGTVYDRLGFKEEEVAIGVDVNQVLQWLGNRDDIVAKFTSDNKGMEPERIEEEVNKFMLDAEMVNAFVAFEKRKADPRNLKAEAEANLSDPSTWGVYAVWIAGGAGFAYVKNVIVEPKYASGEWEEIHITLPGAERFAQATAEKVATETAGAIADVAPVAETVSSVVDAASTSL